MPVVPLRHMFEVASVARTPLKAPASDANSWSTSSFAGATDMSPLEMFDLREHLQRCGRLRGRLFAAKCWLESVDRFLAPRFMTTMVVLALLGAPLLML